MKVYYDQDASFDYLSNKKIAVLGFGSQGHAHSLNLNESGFNVCVGLRKESASWPKAENAGLEVNEISEACKWADVIMVLLPDQNQKESLRGIYSTAFNFNGKTLAFGHGFNIHYKWIVPPKDSKCNDDCSEKSGTSCSQNFSRRERSSLLDRCSPGFYR